MHNGTALSQEFVRLRDRHRDAMQAWVARGVLGSSVIRVFRAGTKQRLLPLLEGLPAHELPALDEDRFAKWYEHQLDHITRCLSELNTRNPRVQPGLKWGHAAKILSLYLRDISLHTRYFGDAEVRRISPWLPVPIDSIIIRRLRRLGLRLPFATIREIDSKEKFLIVQSALAEAAKTAQVPRVWFDDNWAERV